MGLSGSGEPYSAALVVEGAEAERHAGGFLDQPGEGHVGRRGYPPAFRRKVLDLVAAGRPVIEVAGDLGISCQTIYAWRRQDRIDQGLEPGGGRAERRRPGPRSGPTSHGVSRQRRHEMGDMTGQVALVTGGVCGIGRAICERLLNGA